MGVPRTVGVHRSLRVSRTVGRAARLTHRAPASAVANDRHGIRCEEGGDDLSGLTHPPHPGERGCLVGVAGPDIGAGEHPVTQRLGQPGEGGSGIEHDDDTVGQGVQPLDERVTRAAHQRVAADAHEVSGHRVRGGQGLHRDLPLGTLGGHEGAFGTGLDEHDAHTRVEVGHRWRRQRHPLSSQRPPDEVTVRPCADGPCVHALDARARRGEQDRHRSPGVATVRRRHDVAAPHRQRRHLHHGFDEGLSGVDDARHGLSIPARVRQVGALGSQHAGRKGSSLHEGAHRV